MLNNRETLAHSFGIEIAARNVNVNVMTPEGLAVHFGVRRQVPTRGVRLEGLVLTCADPAVLRESLAEGAIAATDHGRFLVVDRAPGQGAFLAFDMAEPAQ